MRFRMLMASLAVAAATVASGLAASPAQAGLGEDCPSGALCAYTIDWMEGTRGQVYANNTNLLQYYAFNNAHSVYNNGNDCNVRIFSGKSYTGTGVTISRDHFIQQLQTSPWYNNIASNKWCV